MWAVVEFLNWALQAITALPVKYFETGHPAQIAVPEWYVIINSYAERVFKEATAYGKVAKYFTELGTVLDGIAMLNFNQVSWWLTDFYREGFGLCNAGNWIITFYEAATFIKV